MRSPKVSREKAAIEPAVPLLQCLNIQVFKKFQSIAHPGRREILPYSQLS